MSLWKGRGCCAHDGSNITTRGGRARDISSATYVLSQNMSIVVISVHIISLYKDKYSIEMQEKGK